MCNEYDIQIGMTDYLAALDAIGLGPIGDPTAADFQPQGSVRIGDSGPVMLAEGNGIRLQRLRFGLPPARPGAGPLFNFRSEGRSFAQSRRCLIPASGFFEFTGSRSPKTRHRFTLNGAPFMAIAGLWRQPAGAPPAFAMLTTAPGPDIAPYHDRQIVVLPPADWAAWLNLSRPEAELLRPLPAGSLAVETLRRGPAATGDLFG